MTTPRHIHAAAAVLAVLLSACSPDSAGDGSLPSSDLSDTFWSDEDAANARDVADVRDSVESGDEIAVVGRVKDFVEGQAAFTLVDSALDSCREIEGDSCATPWDYCCVDPSLVASHTVMVEARDEEGSLVRSDVRGFHGIDHLDEVVVRGEVARDEHGNITVAMQSVHRR